MGKSDRKHKLLDKKKGQKKSGKSPQLRTLVLLAVYQHGSCSDDNMK